MPGPSNNYGSLRLEDDFGIKINEPEILSPKEIPDPQSQLNNNCSYKMPGREPLVKLSLISDEKLSQALDYAMQEITLIIFFLQNIILIRWLKYLVIKRMCYLQYYLPLMGNSHLPELLVRMLIYMGMIFG